MKKLFVFGIVLLLFSLLLLSGCAQNQVAPVPRDNNLPNNSGNATGAASSIPMPPANSEKGNTEVPILRI